ncbi:biotin/lipoyl-binding protein, partial [Vibrio cholerae]
AANSTRRSFTKQSWPTWPAAVLITEAMKMETEVQAAIAGKVTAVHVAKGDRVNPGEILIEIEG